MWTATASGEIAGCSGCCSSVTFSPGGSRPCPLRIASRSSPPIGGRAPCARLRPLWGRTDREAVRWGQGRVIPRHLAVSGNGKGRGAPDDVRSLSSCYRFDEARSLRAVVIRKPATPSPVRASPWSLRRAGQGNAPGPGPRARHRPPAGSPTPTSRRICVPGPTGTRDVRFDKVPTHADPARRRASRSIAPRRRIGRWPCALSVAARWDDYAGGFGRGNNWGVSSTNSVG